MTTETLNPEDPVLQASANVVGLGDDLELFLDQLIEGKKFSLLGEDIALQMKGELRQRLQERINIEILERIPSPLYGEFERMLDVGSEEEVQLFLSTNVAHLDQVIASALLSFEQAYI
jgi:hypothetical protein